MLKFEVLITNALYSAVDIFTLMGKINFNVKCDEHEHRFVAWKHKARNTSFCTYISECMFDITFCYCLNLLFT